jgi:hypothetical protein
MLKSCNTCFTLPGGPGVTGGSRVLPATLEVCKMRSSTFPHVTPTDCSTLHSGDSTAGGSGRGGGLSVQRASVGMAIPQAEKWFGACCGPTDRARGARPTDRRGARVPGGLDQRRGSPGAPGRCTEPDSLLWPAFGVGGDCFSGPDDDCFSGTDDDCFSGGDDDSGGDHDDRWQLWRDRSG